MLDILDELGAPRAIDYLSLDVEGAEGRAKAATATFKAACQTWQRKLAVLAESSASRSQRRIVNFFQRRE